MANLMFEYAAVLGIAQKNGLSPRAAKILYPRDCYLISAGYENEPTDRKRKVYQPNYLSFSPEAFHLEKGVNLLNSNLQSWKYFGHVDDIVRKEFTFFKIHDTYARDFLHTVGDSLKGDIFVSIHVRRTDFMDYPDLINVATVDYFNRAMNLFREKYFSVKFVVASDDKPWSRANLTSDRGDIYFTDDNATKCQDIAVLSHCNHSILSAGSTFGWFGAYRSLGHAIYYKGWLRHGGWYNLELVEEDHYLPWWTDIPG
ncbi:galactoside 2-alpha-L-fucosyltransferase 3-like [Lingula anatina]|uniref:L-Fucosyltransferase n=1 Tax=Lingula anatina TaxID=7574 RepID=A0A1S3IIH0_LINAN|nr:galactoside 2-alpha-L-fucosyltransferase 3-like [Lingula anatina]|eukprot:XP_013398035.1 galactoside 2-alpha-L-fucosyltransferase 3-like [Lingula anatina]